MLNVEHVANSQMFVKINEYPKTYYEQCSLSSLLTIYIRNFIHVSILGLGLYATININYMANNLQ